MAADSRGCIENIVKDVDNVKREFIKENGISNGDTTKRSDIFKDYQLSVSKDKRLWYMDFRAIRRTV